MNENIIRFLEKQTCANICCIDDQLNPWCFTCFYAFDAGHILLHYKSSADSGHSKILLQNPKIAGTILPDKLNKLLVKGIQFEGILLNASDPLATSAAGCFYRKHPLAMAHSGELWTIQINHIKMTDSSAVFGKKTAWSREESDTVAF
jgi:hypothetical protein